MASLEKNQAICERMCPCPKIAAMASRGVIQIVSHVTMVTTVRDNGTDAGTAVCATGAADSPRM